MLPALPPLVTALDSILRELTTTVAPPQACPACGDWVAVYITYTSWTDSHAANAMCRCGFTAEFWRTN